MIIINCEQRTEDWYRLRAGNPGASNVDKIITTKGEISKQREDFLLQMAGEKITGWPEESFTSFAMQQGIDKEAEARALFELATGLDVEQVGLIFKDDRRLFHASPDGLAGGRPLEIKCPTIKTQVKYLLGGALPSEYYGQCQMHLYVTGADEMYFASYYPGLPLFLITHKPHPGYQRALGAALEQFSRDLAQVVLKLQTLTDTLPNPEKLNSEPLVKPAGCSEGVCETCKKALICKEKP